MSGDNQYPHILIGDGGAGVGWSLRAADYTGVADAPQLAGFLLSDLRADPPRYAVVHSGPLVRWLTPGVVSVFCTPRAAAIQAAAGGWASGVLGTAWGGATSAAADEPCRDSGPRWWREDGWFYGFRETNGNFSWILLKLEVFECDWEINDERIELVCSLALFVFGWLWEVLQ